MGDSNYYKRFEDLVEDVFAKLNFLVQREVRVLVVDRFRIADLVLTWPVGNVGTVVEVKVFRTRMPSRDDIYLAYHQAQVVSFALGLQHALLVVNLRCSQLPPLTGDLEGANILCIEDIISLADGAGDVVSELIEMDRELSSSLRDFDNLLDLCPDRHKPDLGKFLTESSSLSTSGQSGSPRGVDTGDLIAKDLESIPVGNGLEVQLPSGEQGVPWRLLEIVGLRALQYLFERQFHRWDDQGKVGGDDQRFDVLAKVKGDDVFSRMLVEDFRSRYVLFEFKNYKSDLKPNLIFVTEKYLFPTALRSTAIIISPKGFSPQALAATHGALRDAGKLILDLPVPALCDMLRKRDEGALIDEEMEKLLDAYLQKIGR